jgi:hypothetical protein
MNETDTITIDLSSIDNNTTTTLSGAYDDTITLSSGPFSFGSNTVVGGGYTYPNNISVTGSPYTITGAAGTNAHPWFNAHASPKIKLDGEGADIEVNGWSLIDAIQKIEERLNILHPNTELETEWEELRALGDQYRKLEKQILEKQATWDRLKAIPAPEID